MSLRYVLKEGASGIQRTKLAAFSSIFALFVSILLLSGIARIGFNLIEFAKVLRQDIEVEIFLQDGVDHQRQWQDLEGYLEEQTWVGRVHFISKDSAAAIFREEFGAEGAALAELDFLPASYRVSVSEGVSVDSIVTQLEQIREFSAVSDIAFNLALMRLLETRIRTFSMIGLGLGAFILAASLLLVFNTIRLTIYAKRDLIRAMKLVGATNGFIRRPFMIEGLLQGFLAGGFACLLHYAFFSYLIPAQLPIVGVMAWPFGRWYFLVGAMMGLSLIMGWWGSTWASRRFIRQTAVTRA